MALDESLALWLAHQRSNAASSDNRLRATIRSMLTTALDAVELDSKETAMSRIRHCIRELDKQTSDFNERLDKMHKEFSK